ncbi:hypothetical protein [Prevotella sp. KH2C16]|uniref:hypothetical protein n=1 Tax=Prevotella sp. KH2C16 TaxID=1855325 RepID=UPI0008ECF973|nr:hypothetical protein [Prevotella sp. KH2C16]SFF92142.1 3-oxoacyl-[acyl-carrier-protein] synthase-1 [Prevotella sp. KH2C16]
MKQLHHIRITPREIMLDGQAVRTAGEGLALLKNAYQTHIGEYPKFHKMDGLCKLGFVASDLLLQAEGTRNFDGDGHVQEAEAREDRAVILFNRSGSLETDRQYQATIDAVSGYYPSPALFVYTLSNIVTGEICIRNGYRGESSFYVLPGKDLALMEQMVDESFMDESMRSALWGWVDYTGEHDFEAEMYLSEK